MVRVLVVEDNLELNDTVCSFLEYSGHSVVGCLCAKEARQRFLDEHFDIIVSDIMMPDEDGYEFVESIREVDSNIPVILMTARDDIASKQKGFRIGVDDYMVKPIDLYELSLRIGALLRRANIVASNRLQVGRFVMDSEERAVYLGDDEICVVLLDVLCTDLLCDELLVVLSHSIPRSHDFGIGIIKEYVGMNDIFRRCFDYVSTEKRSMRGFWMHPKVHP
jgi:DNA-binding response OmpR family regulator